jgi:hypothetical protein
MYSACPRCRTEDGGRALEGREQWPLSSEVLCGRRVVAAQREREREGEGARPEGSKSAASAARSRARWRCVLLLPQSRRQHFTPPCREWASKRTEVSRSGERQKRRRTNENNEQASVALKRRWTEAFMCARCDTHGEHSECLDSAAAFGCGHSSRKLLDRPARRRCKRLLATIEQWADHRRQELSLKRTAMAH